jgi:hypothetical protein
MKFISTLLIVWMLLIFSCARTEKKTETQIRSSPSIETARKKPEGVMIENQVSADTLRGSLKAYATAAFGNYSLTVTYHSPAVRGRIIWGGLVPFDQVWVTGAHMATTIESDVDFVFGDKVIKAGKYALFTIPGKEKWIVILNRNWQQHLTDEYDSKDDEARIYLTPKNSAENQERLQYKINVLSPNECWLELRWEKLSLHIPLTIINPEFD